MSVIQYGTLRQMIFTHKILAGCENSRSLLLCRIIRVYNSNPTHQRHCNGHFPLGDGVHWGGD